MSKLLRYKTKGDIYFLTNITNSRNKILINNFELLYDSISKYNASTGVKSIAWVILPDHFHLVVNSCGADISEYMQKIKLSFSRKYCIRHNINGHIWQRRFWDHVIRDKRDFNKHIDYIHYNPVKHGYVSKPLDWKYSSFKKFLTKGYYDDDWGDLESIKIDGDFGE